MKTVYLAREQQPDGSHRLVEISAEKWHAIIKEQAGLPMEQKHHFIEDIIYDENGNPKLSEYDQPIYLLKGYWGGKTYLTQGGLNGTDSGMFKKNFDAVVTDDGDLLTVYNAYDTDYSTEGIAIENNKVVVAKYDTDPE